MPRRAPPRRHPRRRAPRRAGPRPRLGRRARHSAGCSSAARRTPGSGARPSCAAEQHVARVRVLARGADLTCSRKAPHQQLVRAVVEPVQRDRARGQRRRVERTTGGERRQRRVPQQRLADARQRAAARPAARRRTRPGARIDALQQLAANPRRISLARSQCQHVDHGRRRQPELHRVSPERAGHAERAPQLRQRPPQGPARILGVAEDERGQPRPRHRPLRQHQVGQHGPRLVTTRRTDDDPVPVDLRRSQQAQHQRGHDTAIVVG